MNFLVTGGGGFVGSALVEELLNRGEKVRWVIYASSSSVYGDTPILPKKEEFRENPPRSMGMGNNRVTLPMWAM